MAPEGCRRVRRHPAAWRVLLAGLALALGAGLLSPAAVQAQEILVDNSSETPFSSPREANRKAQAFMTGPNAHGYRLNSITLKGQNFIASNGNTATLHEGSRTGRKVADFNAAVEDGGNDLVLTPTDIASLKLNTTYIILSGEDFGNARWEDSSSGNQSGAMGWSIANNSEFSSAGSSIWGTASGSMLITVRGEVRPPPPSTAHCNPSDPNEIWCATLVVGTEGGGGSVLGFNSAEGFGSLTDDDFTYPSSGGVSYSVSRLTFGGGSLDIKLDPAGLNIFNRDEFRLVVGTCGALVRR